MSDKSLHFKEQCGTCGTVVKSCRCFDGGGDSNVTIVTCDECNAKRTLAVTAHHMAKAYLVGPGLQRWKEAVLKAVVDAASSGRFEVLVPSFDGDDAKAWLQREGLKVVGGQEGGVPYESKVLLSWQSP